MFIAKNEVILHTLFEKANNLCGHLNNHVTILVKFMEGGNIGHHILLIVTKGLLENMVPLILNQVMIV